MFSIPSRSLLTAIVAGQVATGCFLSGDYKVEEKTVHATLPQSTEDVTSSDGFASDVTPPRSDPSYSASNVATDDDPAPTEAASSSPDASTSASSDKSTDALDLLTSEGNTSQLETGDGDTRGSGDSSSGSDSTLDPCSGRDCSSPCAHDEVLGPQGRCYWFNAGQGNWNAARTTCESRGQGWVPIAIHNEEEDDFVSSHLNREGQTWLGARFTLGAWRWLDDDTAFWNGPGKIGAIRGVFVKWGTNEPSGAPGETCSRVQSFNGQMRWGDNDCNGNRLIACQSPIPGE